MLRTAIGLIATGLALAGCTDADSEPSSDLSSNVVNADLDDTDSFTPDESTDQPGSASADQSTTGDLIITVQDDTDTTTASTTTTESKPSSTSEAPPQPVGQRFATLPPGSRLPSGSDCAQRVRSAPETRAGNARFNQTKGSNPHDEFPRVDGNFTGTTDEILQWVACKWGIDEDIVRAQAVIESWWDMTTGGDRTGDQSACHPDLRRSSGDCPESIGLLQVRFLYHGDAFEDSNAIRSTAYNADYTYAVWRECFEGRLGWLNDVERGRQYQGGDVDGCLGVWFSGRWHTQPAVDYFTRLNDIKAARTWESADFLGYG